MADAIAAQVRAAEQAIGVDFRDPSLLQLALVHSSLLNEPEGYDERQFEASNERLEFLGDAVVGLLVAEYLYARDPELPEGRLTVQRAMLVRRETLARWAVELDLGELLFIGRGELQGDIISDRVLAGAFEAVVGAIYLDQGFEAARNFMTGILDRHAARALAGQDALSNYKGQLQERIQRDDTMLPAYAVVSQEGPDHDRQFVVEVRHRGRTIGRGVGRSKRIAEQAAARDALDNLLTEEDQVETPHDEQRLANGAEAH